MRDGKKLLLLLLSLCLTATWVYHFYDKSNYSKITVQEKIVKDTAGVAAVIKDSLERYYAALLPDPIIITDTLSTEAADSLRQQLSSRLDEIKRLRQTLSNRNISKEELKSAKTKIMELRTEIDEMKTHQISLEEERKRLSSELDHLSSDMKGMQENIGRLDNENKELKEIVSNASTLSSSDVKLSIVDSKSGNTEVETSKVKRADKFVVSFVVQNAIAQFTNAEVFVVITAPDGSIVTNTVWDSGIFDTKKEGRKTYTRKLRFEYEKSEQKRLIFTLDYDNFSKGTYKIQVYHNGQQIGETSKTLS